MYEVQSRSDFQAGATLVVKIPEADLDIKALYTIAANRPSFILPFHHKIFDGEVEFTYHIGDNSKLVYISGDRSPEAYIDLWINILQPLLDCGDWFMTPYSFVLEAEHLYCDKSGKSIRFVYVPSLRSSSDYDALKNMVADVAKQNHVTDISLENKVVWAIQDFNMNDFFQVIKTYRTQGLRNTDEGKAQKDVYSEQRSASAKDSGFHILNSSMGVRQCEDAISVNVDIKEYIEEEKPKKSLFGNSKKKESKSKEKEIDFEDEMPTDSFLELDKDGFLEYYGKGVKKEKKNLEKVSFGKNEPEKPKQSGGEKKRQGEYDMPEAPKAKGGLFGSKEKKEKGKRGGLFGNKKSKPQEIIQGAAAIPYLQNTPYEQPLPSAQVPAFESFDDLTQLDFDETCGAKLRYIGSGLHPKIILVNIMLGKVFTIGRFDSSVGTKQSDFEFAKDTISVSRRHAVIERNNEGYFILDLSSKAGTYINGKKLPPNAPFKLELGSRISFGHSGADYTWDDCRYVQNRYQ